MQRPYSFSNFGSGLTFTPSMYCPPPKSTMTTLEASSSLASSHAASSFDDDDDLMVLASSPFSVMMSSEEDESSSSSSSPPSSSSCASSMSSSVSSSLSDQRNKLRKKKKKRLCASMSSATFDDMYYLTGDAPLGEGSYGRVETCVHRYTDTECAVKIISKANWGFSRSKVLKEVELYYLCQGQAEIVQLIEYFEEPDFFYLIFEKAHGGPLLNHIQRRVHFGEEEARVIVRDLARALRFLHARGIAHRDLKPENVLCMSATSILPVKLCDFDLCSSVNQTLSTPLLQSPVGSAEYMAPEVVNAFSSCCCDDDLDDEDDDELTYDKKCDLWSLGVIAYILLCGYLPFSASAHCDDGCGWDRGEECLHCQRSLFSAIRDGNLVFPDQHWSSISKEAKDLISKLLVKDSTGRLDAESVLTHPWISQSSATPAKSQQPRLMPRVMSVPRRLNNNNGHFGRQHHRKTSCMQAAFNFSGDSNNNNNDDNSVAGKMRRQTSLVFFPEQVERSSNYFFHR